MTVVQVLTVNLLTDGLPALALARDPGLAGTMRARRSRPDALFERELELALVVAGVTVGLAATAAYLIGRELAPDAAQTMAFATVALAELVFVYTLRSASARVARPAEPRLARQRPPLGGVPRLRDLPRAAAGRLCDCLAQPG